MQPASPNYWLITIRTYLNTPVPQVAGSIATAILLPADGCLMTARRIGDSMKGCRRYSGPAGQLCLLKAVYTTRREVSILTFLRTRRKLTFVGVSSSGALRFFANPGPWC